MVAVRMVVGVVVLSAVAGCGSHVYHGRVRVRSVALTAAAGFPGAPGVGVVVDRGAVFARVVRLVPLPLPAEAEVPRGSRTRHPLTVCFPMNLTIGLSNGTSVIYPACRRPRSLRKVVRLLCPLLRKRGFCADYRRELAGSRA
jgi:hypothetical protein